MLEKKQHPLLSPGWQGLRCPQACVIGLGLIGGSWAGALHRIGWKVIAVDASKNSLALAEEQGWIEQGFLEIPPHVDADLVILALPLPLIRSGIETLVGRLNPGTIVTDVGSVKGEVCSDVKSLLSSDTGLGQERIFFIGGHPMTGSEKSGFGAAEPNLFQGYPYVLIAEDCPEEVVESLSNLLSRLGAQVVLREKEQHDLEVAMVSHIPHLLSVALALAAEDISHDGSALQLAGRSFREVTRIVESSPAMWQEILIQNSEAILHGLDQWQSRLNQLRGYVQAQDGANIAQAFRQAAIVRNRLRYLKQ